MPPQLTIAPPTVHTVTLEDQGVPADIANHRRSVLAQQFCQANVEIERYDPKQGRRRTYVERCQNHAISLDEHNVNHCEMHRTVG